MMRHYCLLLLTIAVLGWPHAADAADGQMELRVLYLGNAGTERADAYAEFLAANFRAVETADREHFIAESAEGFDVVLLDWSQSDTDSADATSPLGQRQKWSTPTILLGSAGHLLAGPWEIIGGAG